MLHLDIPLVNEPSNGQQESVYIYNKCYIRSLVKLEA